MPPPAPRALPRPPRPVIIRKFGRFRARSDAAHAPELPMITTRGTAPEDRPSTDRPIPLVDPEHAGWADGMEPLPVVRTRRQLVLAGRGQGCGDYRVRATAAGCRARRRRTCSTPTSSSRGASSGGRTASCPGSVWAKRWTRASTTASRPPSRPRCAGTPTSSPRASPWCTSSRRRSKPLGRTRCTCSPPQLSPGRQYPNLRGSCCARAGPSRVGSVIGADDDGARPDPERLQAVRARVRWTSRPIWATRAATSS